MRGGLTCFHMLVATACLALSACLCSDEVISEEASPDGRIVATAFVRDCGATTDFMTSVSLHNKGMASDKQEDIIFVAKGRHRPSLAWNGHRSLAIECTSCRLSQVRFQATVAGGVEIRYALSPD